MASSKPTTEVGVFLVTTFWEEGTDELKQATAAICAAKDAGFPHHTFVIAPFYYQNLVGVMAPQKQTDGSLAWVLPLDPDVRCIHMGDIVAEHSHVQIKQATNQVCGMGPNEFPAMRGTHK